MLTDQIAITGSQTFFPLDRETRVNVPTAVAAIHLMRSPMTLRHWAVAEDAPIKPLRIGGRLAWPVAEIRRLLGVTA